MCIDLIVAIIGVIGTLIGTILGFILGKINFGKLHFHFSFTGNMEDGFVYEKSIINPDEPEKLRSFSKDINLRIYNSSEQNDVIYDCEIVFQKDKVTKSSMRVIDPSTVRVHPIITTADGVEELNIPPKAAIHIPVTIKNPCPVNDILECDKISFAYKNKRYRQKQIIIEPINFIGIPSVKEESSNEQ